MKSIEEGVVLRNQMNNMKFQKGHKTNVGNNWNLGKKRSQETKDKISKTLSGRVSTTKGIKYSQEHKNKLSKIAKEKGFGKWMTGRPLPNEIKLKVSNTLKGRIPKNIPPPRSGNKSNLWKGGITPVNRSIRASTEYKKWRKGVFERDNHKCIIGGKSHGYKLEAHHIKSFASYPELRFDINNGQTLCVDCHKNTESYGPTLTKNI